MIADGFDLALQHVDELKTVSDRRKAPSHQLDTGQVARMLTRGSCSALVEKSAPFSLAQSHGKSTCQIRLLCG